MQVLQARQPAYDADELTEVATVLLVEDEDLVRRLVAELLRRDGYAVLAAARPSEAVEAAERHGGEIHVLLTDVVMPEMNGPQLAVRLREGRPELKVLYMSGYEDTALSQHGVAPGEHAFVGKPFAPAELARAVRALLDR